MNVTLASVFSWDTVVGANYDVRILNGGGTEILPVTDVGSTTSYLLTTALTGQATGLFKLQVRTKNPDGSLTSSWAELMVTLVGFPAPTGLAVA